MPLVLKMGKLFPLHARMSKKYRGFTLIEILLVIAGLSVLASIVIQAINPSQQLAAMRNGQRQVDIKTILEAINQYTIDNNGAPSTITATSSEICKHHI